MSQQTFNERTVSAALPVTAPASDRSEQLLNELAIKTGQPDRFAEPHWLAETTEIKPTGRQQLVASLA